MRRFCWRLRTDEEGLLMAGSRAISFAMKTKQKPKPAGAPTPAAATPTTTLPAAITFRVNIVVPGEPSRPYSAVFVRAGDASPYRSLDEIPEQLRAFIGTPPAMPDTADFEAEEQMIRDSFGPISESVAEELERRQSEAVSDAVALNAIKLEQSERQDQFERDLQAERDKETEQLYEAQPQKGKNP